MSIPRAILDGIDGRELERCFKAAESGDAKAQFQIGILHQQGDQGFAQDYEQAAKWYRRAAEQGHAGAQLYFGVLLAQSQGVKQDLIEAFKWIELAKRGNALDKDVAVETQKRLVAFMNTEQIAEGQRRSQEFIATKSGTQKLETFDLREEDLRTEEHSRRDTLNAGNQHRTRLNDLQEISGRLIVKGFRRISEQHGCAPTGMTSDPKIVEIYSKVGTAFEEAAKMRGEHISALCKNFIVLKFFAVWEMSGDLFMQKHLQYEVNKYITEGLREDYRRGELELFDPNCDDPDVKQLRELMRLTRENLEHELLSSEAPPASVSNALIKTPHEPKREAKCESPMNKNQKTLTMIALGAFAMTLLCAPWDVVDIKDSNGTLSRKAYAPLLAPPQPNTQLGSSKLDVSVMTVEWLAIGIIYGGLYLLNRDNPKSSR